MCYEFHYSGIPLNGHPWWEAALSITTIHLGPHYIEIVLIKPLICGHPSIYNGRNFLVPTAAIIEGFNCIYRIYSNRSHTPNSSHPQIVAECMCKVDWVGVVTIAMACARLLGQKPWQKTALACFYCSVVVSLTIISWLFEVQSW